MENRFKELQRTVYELKKRVKRNEEETERREEMEGERRATRRKVQERSK